MKNIDQFSIRKQNIRKILSLLGQHPLMTRQELAEASSLSLMTVTNLVDLLKAHHVLAFSPTLLPERRSGRKAENIALCSGRHAWLVVDISSRRFRFSLLGFDLAMIREGAESEPAPGTSYLHRLEAFLADVRRQVQEATPGWTIPGVSVVAPGPYEITSDTVKNQRLPELNGICVKSLFRRHLGPYEYYVDEDVKFAVRAFNTLTDKPECELLYYLFMGEGVGGASVHGGNMLRGLNAAAGDAGQLMDDQGRRYESRLSLRAFADSLGLESVTLEELPAHLHALSVQQPDIYLKALEKAAVITADMLFNVLWLLDPSHIIIDCQWAFGFEKTFIDLISSSLTQRFAASPRQLPHFAPAPDGMSSVLRGAVQVLQREWVERIVS